jgi:hypothetical protein
MPEFVIEREMPGVADMTPEQAAEAGRASLEVLRELGPDIRWIRSFVTSNKIYCVYYATSVELIREHAKRLGVPANRIEMVRGMLDPADFKTA